MKILLVIGEASMGNNFLARTISKIDNVKIQVIIIKKKKSLISKIKKIIINFLIFIYTPNFKLKFYVSNLFKIKSKFVDNLDSLDIIQKIDEFSPDLLVISGTKKIHQKILTKVRFKINLHHGVVPNYRGVSSSDWVSYEGDFGNFGVTVHEATEIIDEGPLLKCERIFPFRGEPLFLFKRRIFWEGYFILINCIQQIVKKKITWTPQDNINSRNLKQIDKPTNFYEFKMKTINNFDKFSSLNGSKNLFFFLKDKFNKIKIQKKLNSGWYILNYHDICTEVKALHYEKYKYPSIYTTLNNFKSHIEFMQQEGEIVSVKDALNHWTANNIKDKILFSITFDDGLYSSIEAMSLLKDLNITPTLFFNGDPFLNRETILDNHSHLKEEKNDKNIFTNYLSINDLNRVFKNKSYLFELGSHTFSHKNLSKLNANKIKYEINDCHNYLENFFNTKIAYFAFPFGKLNKRNYHADKAARSLGVKIFECYGGVNKSFAKHFNILRIGIHNETKENFHSLLSKQWIR